MSIRSDDKLIVEKNTCPVCGSPDISLCMEIPRVPVHCNVLCSTHDEACGVPRGDIRLAFCKKCCHLFNAAFQSDLMKYDQDYENSLHFSQRFQEYAENLAKRLIDKYDLHDKDIIEIGCGKGDFLMLLCEMGGNRGIGFDASYDPGRADDEKRQKITFIQDFYSSQYGDYKAACICCRHVLEHIQFPRKFLTDIRNTIKNCLDPLIFFEVPNGMFTLKDLGIWDLIYEHCSYFCKTSLLHLFTTCGFDVSECTETFGGQYLSLEATPAEGSGKPSAVPEQHIDNMSHYVTAFKGNYNRSVMNWQQKLEDIRKHGKRAVVWGAGSKGITFLNVLRPKEEIKYLIDVNPYKKGKYIAGVGKKIMTPEFLRDYDPNIIIIMNSIYSDEIRKIVRQLGLSPEILIL